MAKPTEATTSPNQPTTPVMVLRVFEPGQPTFQLRKGEEGISVFAPEFVEPQLSEAEVLADFRSGSAIVVRPVSVV
jgi:hypothetical protein